MFRKTSGLLIAALLVSAAMVPMAAQAATPGYLVQVGNGAGQQEPILPGLNLRDVLYDATGFPLQGTIQQPNWLGYGTQADGTVVYTTSQNGSTWTSVTPVTIRDEAGNDIPLVIGAAGRLAVTYITNPALPQGNQFVLAYAPLDHVATEMEAGNDGKFRANNIRIAYAANAKTFLGDHGLTDADPAGETLAQAGTFKEVIRGPLDLQFLDRRGASSDCLSGTPAPPFGCDFVITYLTQNAAGTEHISIAGGTFLNDSGLTAVGHTAPILSSGTGWASGTVDRAHLAITNGSGCTGSNGNSTCEVEMTFAGGTSLEACESVSDNCRIGTASSAPGDALSFSLDRTVPSVSDPILAQLRGTTALNVNYFQRVPTSPPTYLFSTLDSFEPQTHMAYGVDAPGPEPRIVFVEPSNSYSNVNESGVQFNLYDDAGTIPGIKTASLEVKFDGVPFGGNIAVRGTVIGAIERPGKAVYLDESQLNLSDGDHLLEVSVEDEDGNLVSDSKTIHFDSTPPITAIVTTDSNDTIFPLTSIYFNGTSVEAPNGSALAFMRGTVTNPLGQTISFDEGPGRGNMHAGFSFSNISADEKSWDWGWAVPVFDPLFFLVPGNYVFTASGIDFAGNVEPAHAGNTVSRFILAGIVQDQLEGLTP